MGVPVTEHLPVVLDTSRLASLADEIGDRGLVMEAVQAFLDELPGRLQAIRDAVAVGDPEKIRSVAHALGSPAAMLGATAVSVSTREMQNAAMSDEDEDLDERLVEIETASRLSVAAMTDYLNQTV
jgi:HPt (histidine-containing phosphotransfer) domain-containing protein